MPPSEIFPSRRRVKNDGTAASCDRSLVCVCSKLAHITSKRALKIHLLRGMVDARKHSKEDASKPVFGVAVLAIRRVSRRERNFVGDVEIMHEDLL